MRIAKVISTVESHTAGEPFRIVTSGLPMIQGETIIQRRSWLKANFDHLRTALMHEPRGHAHMYGGYLTPPVSPEGDFGIIFVHNDGYSDHCGHGVIALATAAVQLGWVQRTIPETQVGIDAPCGFIHAFVGWDGERVSGVRFRNVPSFLYKRNVSVETRSFGVVTGDIAFGGAFYFYTSGIPYGLEIREADVDNLVRFGAEVKEAANASIKVVHPSIPEINHIYGTVIHNAPRDSTATQANCCVFADREVDRSPTGSGTAGRLAQLYARGELAIGELLINESVIGTTFRGRVIEETKVEDIQAVIAEVEGAAYLCGFANWVIDDDDALRDGFLVR